MRINEYDQQKQTSAFGSGIALAQINRRLRKLLHLMATGIESRRHPGALMLQAKSRKNIHKIRKHFKHENILLYLSSLHAFYVG